MASVLKLIDKQLGMWDLKHRLEELLRPGRCIEEGVAYGPCLLVSRECGSGGSQLARRVAQRLGWQAFDREILEEIAQLAHVRARLLNTVDEKTRLAWGEAWRPELAPEDIGYEMYLRYLRQVVLTLGHHGDVVILGRGAQYFLPARCSLRVRAVAPLEWRVRRVLEANGQTAEEAQRQVEKFDADRAEFVRRSFHRDPGSALNYDLVINTGEIGLEVAAGLVLKALEDKLHVRPPKC